MKSVDRLPPLNALQGLRSGRAQAVVRPRRGGAARHQGGRRAAGAGARAGDRRAAGRAVRAGPRADRIRARPGRAGSPKASRSSRARRARCARPRAAAFSSSIRAPPSPRPGSSAGSASSRRSIPKSTCCSTPTRSRMRWNSSTTDALIRWGAGDFPGLATTLLFKEDVFPVCSPELVAGDNPLRAPEDLEPPHAAASRSGARPIRRGRPGPTGSRRQGRETSKPRHGVWFNNMAMAIRAAAQGQGVALSSFAIAADELAAGRLVAPFSTSVQTPFGYYFLCRPEEAGNAAHQGLARVFGRGGGALGGGAGVR